MEGYSAEVVKAGDYRKESGVGLLQAEAVKDGVAGLLGSVEDEIDPLAVDVDAFRLVDQLGNIL